MKNRLLETLLPLLVCTNLHAYTIGELDETDLTMMTLQNAPQTHCSTEAPIIEVSNNSDFTDSYVGSYMFKMWDLEDSAHAAERLQTEHPDLSQYERYVTFGMSQPDVTGLFENEDTVTLSYGWKYARSLCTPNNNGVCVNPDDNAVSLDQYVGVVATDFPRGGGTVPVEPIDYYNNSGTTWDQVNGLLDQLDTLFTSQEVGLTNLQASAKKYRSSADLFGKVDELKQELMVLRRMVEDSKPATANTNPL